MTVGADVPETPGDGDGTATRAVIAMLIAGLGSLRLLLPFAPDRLFDVDPASVAGPFPAVGSAGSLLLDAMLVLLAGIGLATASRRRGVDRPMLVLLLLPFPVVVWHGWSDQLDAWRGFDWFAAVAAGVALAHLVRTPAIRRAVLAIVLAAIAANVVRGLHQVFVEHPDTVAFFDANRDAIFAARGWVADSPAALIYERRLRQPEAIGWIGFSNVLSGLLAAGGVLAIGLLVTARKLGDGEHRGAGGPVMLGVAGTGCLLLVGLNGSKGAIAASAVGVLGLLLLLGPLRETFLRRSGAWLIAVGGLAFAAIVLRGLLPEDFAGDRSLLFRWHYLQGGFAMFLEHPWLGVGPDGFQNAYLSTRPIRSPESVASAHSVLVDWLASLGVSGIGWLLVAGLIVLRRDSSGSDGDDADVAFGAPLAIAAGLMALIVVILQAWVEGPLLGDGLAVRVAATLAAVITGAAAWSVSSRLADGFVRGVAVAAAGVLVAQSQIEMLLWQPGSLVACWALLACSGGAVGRRSETGASSRGTRSLVIPVVFAVVAGVMAIGGLRDALATAEAGRSISALHRTPADDRPPPSAADRREAAESLVVDLVERGGWNDPRRVRGAITLFMTTGLDADRRRAATIAGAWSDARPGVASAATHASVLEAIAIASSDPSDEREAAFAIERVIEFDPYDASWRLRLAERLAALVRCDEAIVAVDEAIRLDATQDLDPLAQFGPEQGRRVDAIRSACGSRGD
ncbi:MAG TPA: hypothetical protein DCG14_04060 [Phycisphaerales bacterium]|nr:hypothetical protein [Phycisphaerales bacterium]